MGMVNCFHRLLGVLTFACCVLAAHPALAQGQGAAAAAAPGASAPVAVIPSGAPGWVAPRSRALRPELAPRLHKHVASAELQQQRLRGVHAPWPGNLSVIARQGAWYTPLFHPGMTGPYDLRGWHPPIP